jgi:hypothetical protein
MEMLKEKVQMTKEIITNEMIHISCEHTEFCRMTRVSYPDITALEKEIKQLRKELKSKKVKLDKTETLKMLKEQKVAYIEMVNDYNNTFDALVDAWKNKMEVGVYSGYGDDEYMNNVIKPLRIKLTKMDYQTSILDKVKRIERKVNEIKNELSYGTEYISVAI